MSPQVHWAGVSVHEFFQGYNWSGDAVVLSPSLSPEEVSSLPSLVCLSVGNFLQQVNWLGKAHPSQSEISPPVAVTETPPALTLSVADFFRRFNAQAPVQEASAARPTPLVATAPDLDLTDLSGLF
ncbi:hypothetical protein [Synechocystis sp. LKSZ1]|uniref:hypothetical protein n=1 Tax=Synechocystis sp. LKSZ1 TaxID=3144951 RepID=UPI00336BDACF